MVVLFHVQYVGHIGHVLHVWNLHMSCVRMPVYVHVRVRVRVRVCPRVSVCIRVCPYVVFTKKNTCVVQSGGAEEVKLNVM